jgi:hypothetical protein
VGLERVHSTSWVQLRSYLIEKVAAPVNKIEIMAVGDPQRWLRDTPLPAKYGTNFPGRSVGIVRSRTQATECDMVTI